MDEQLLILDKFKLIKHKGIPQEAIDFLESILWGSKGVVYENKNMKTHIHELYNPSLMAVYDENKIIGTAAFCNTDVKVKKATYNCNYIKYFASSEEFRGKGITKEVTKNIMEFVRQGEKAKTIYFACVEKGNKGSYKVVINSGYELLGTIKTIGFSRFFPKKSNGIERIETQTSREEILSVLQATYSDYSLFHVQAIFKNNNYYVIRKNGEIIAGCQYHRGHWKVNKMKGLSGKVILNILPKLPLIRKIFNPEKFEFLAFEGIFFKDGHEKDLYELFEGVLFLEKLNSAMFWMDSKCPISKKIVDYGKLGMLHSFVKKSDVFVLSSYANISADEIEEIRNSPIYASAFDYV